MIHPPKRNREAAPHAPGVNGRPAKAVTDERRRHGRSAVAWHGRIMISQAPSVACVVLNVSERGAKLRLRLPIDLPGGFVLSIDRFGDLQVELLDQEQAVVRVGFLEPPAKIRKFFRNQLPAFRNAPDGGDSAKPDAGAADAAEPKE
ncbi:MAG: hypothetical protein IT562_02900 [Alphaproteobacteria bacterium]|nr:hypothetical protein [Alphaproteobacteria bacterium]